MSCPGSVTLLIHELRSEDAPARELAARLIWGRYFRELLSLAKRHLGRRIRLRESEEDILQSMFKSFYLRQRRGEFDLANRDDLWGLLVTITIRKALNAANRNQRAKRDVRRELCYLDGDSGLSQWALEQTSARGPTPAEAALLNEELERRLAALADPELLQVAICKLEGFTNREIAEERRCTERTIERKLERIRSRWARIANGEA